MKNLEILGTERKMTEESGGSSIPLSRKGESLASSYLCGQKSDRRWELLFVRGWQKDSSEVVFQAAGKKPLVIG